jgi:hypothetical protein
MTSRCFRQINNPISGLAQAKTEIDVFKPSGPKTFIEAADVLPCGSVDHQERTGWLVHIRSVANDAAITAIYRIPWRDSVHTQYFKGQSPRTRETPDVKAVLRHTGAVE